MRSIRDRSREGGRLVLYGVAVNAALTVVKVMAGVAGNSNALLADGLESALDIFSSVLIWGALLYAARPPDSGHPYGHGKLESLASVVAAIFVMAAGGWVALHSARAIYASFAAGHPPPPSPEPWTLAVLVIVIATKETFFRILLRASRRLGSTAMQAEAWHHRSDAITSVAAFAGISIAVIGGPGWESADGWAALLSCVFILRNGARMLRLGIGEVIDQQVSPEIAERILAITCAAPGVSSAEKIRVRKSGMTLIADLHIRVSGDLTVRRGHEISHDVKDRLLTSDLALSDVTVHLEPEDKD
jgi:cation diffusion facilitator family transporter